jgi:putative tricarboxylic transport membrane protein
LAPYLLVLAGAGYLCFLTFRFDFLSQGDQVGPEFWPRTICVFMIITCTVKILHLCFSPTMPDSGGQPSPARPEIPAGQPHPVLVSEGKHGRLDIWLGIGTMALYLLAFRTLGYFLSTFLFMLAFIYLGQYRKVGIILAVSALGSLIFMFIFMKVVYISLPIGVEPFSSVSVFLMKLMNVR